MGVTFFILLGVFFSCFLFVCRAAGQRATNSHHTSGPYESLICVVAQGTGGDSDLPTTPSPTPTRQTRRWVAHAVSVATPRWMAHPYSIGLTWRAGVRNAKLAAATAPNENQRRPIKKQLRRRRRRRGVAALLPPYPHPPPPPSLFRRRCLSPRRVVSGKPIMSDSCGG